MQISILLKIINHSIKQVPSVKYALAIAGIISVIAIIEKTGINYPVAIFGSIIMILLMSLLFVFSKLTTTPNKNLHYPKLFLVWSSIVLTIGAIVLLLTSIFFSHPLDLQNLLTNKNKIQEKQEVRDLILQGRIVDESNENLPGAEIIVYHKRYLSDSNGNFHIKLPATLQDPGVKMTVTLAGYQSQNFDLSESRNMRIILKKSTHE